MMTVAEVRALIASIPEGDRCSPDCRGWAIFDTDAGRVELADADGRQLPEARQALAGVLLSGARQIRRLVRRQVYLPTELVAARALERRAGRVRLGLGLGVRG